MAFFRIFTSIRNILGRLSNFLPDGLRSRWRLSVFFSVILPAADIILASWLYVLIMVLQQESVGFASFKIGRDQLVLCLVIFVILTIVRQSLDLLSLTYSRRLTQSIFRKISKQLIARYISMPWLDFAGDNKSAKIKHCTVTTLDAAYSYQLVLNFLNAFSTLLLLGFVILYKMPGLALAVVSSVIILIFINRRYIARKVGIDTLMHESYQRIYHQKLHEVFELPREINLLKVTEHFLDSIDGQLKKLSSIKSDLSILPQLPRILIEVLITITIALPLFFISSSQDQSSKELIASFSTIALLARRILPAISELLSSYSDLYGSMMNLKIVDTELNNDLAETSSKQVLSGFNEAYIILENISFSYRDGRPILNNVNLTISPNDRLVLFGKTGAGKSTLLMIAAGLIKPALGNVLFKSEIVQGNELIGYVAQDIKLLNGTVLDNIIFGNKEIDEKFAWKMLHAVNLDEHIKQLPEGIHTPIGDNGITFSGGQRQRLGIARALYFRPKVLFLDEATSAIDEHTERTIMENINTIMADGAVVFITHRKSNADLNANRFCYL